MAEEKVVITGVFHQCEVKYGMRPVVNAMEELEALEQKKKNKDGTFTYVSYVQCVNCGTRVSFSYRKVD